MAPLGPADRSEASRHEVLRRFASLRQHQRDGKRSPHKPLLALLALGRLATTGSSTVPWSEAEVKLAALLREFGPRSGTGPAQSAAYPFTRLRADGVWLLDHDVPMDLVGPLGAHQVSGHFDDELEHTLRADPVLLRATVRSLVHSHFPASIAPDVLRAIDLDPDSVLGTGWLDPTQPQDPAARKRSAAWREAILLAWERRCAFCGYDGQLSGRIVGLEAAHVRWFAHDGPDDPDNGLALCMLHHKLFDLGALGLTPPTSTGMRIRVSPHFEAGTPAGRAVQALHNTPLRPNPTTALPALTHITWHDTQVFKGLPLQTPA